MHAVSVFQTTFTKSPLPTDWCTATNTTATTPWRKSAIGQPQTAKAANKPTTAKMERNLSQKEIMGMVHFLGVLQR